MYITAQGPRLPGYTVSSGTLNFTIPYYTIDTIKMLKRIFFKHFFLNCKKVLHLMIEEHDWLTGGWSPVTSRRWSVTVCWVSSCQCVIPLSIKPSDFTVITHASLILTWTVTHCVLNDSTFHRSRPSVLASADPTRGVVVPAHQPTVVQPRRCLFPVWPWSRLKVTLNLINWSLNYVRHSLKISWRFDQ